MTWKLVTRIGLGATAVGAGLAWALVAERAPQAATRANGAPSVRLPNVPLVTHDGRRVRFYDDLVRGKLVVINFVYASCLDACPLETARLRQVQKVLGDRVGRDIFIYSITIDPRRDTPEVLKQYAEKFHAGAGWTFLTGEEADITLLRKKLGLYSEGGLSDHTANLVVGNDATGQWLRHNSFENPQYLAVIIGEWLNAAPTSHADAKSYAEAPPTSAPARGQYLFDTRCAACHTFGKASELGPDLAGVTNRRDRQWLTRWLAEPDRMLAEGDPIAIEQFNRYNKVPMPNLRLSAVDVAALLDYLELREHANHNHEDGSHATK